MSIDNNIGSTPGSGHASPRRQSASAAESGRAVEADRKPANAARTKDASAAAASTAAEAEADRKPANAARTKDASAAAASTAAEAEAEQKLREGARLEARILSITLADQQLQQNLQLRNQQAALLALRLQLLNQTLPGSGVRDGTSLTTTISASQLSAALADSGQKGLLSADMSDGTTTLQRLRQAVNAQPFVQLRVSGGRLELLSAAARPASAEARLEATLQSQQQSLAKWMPLQADTRASLRALLDTAGLIAAAANAGASGLTTDAASALDSLQARLAKALAGLTPPGLSHLRTEGFLQQHMQGSGQFMESKLAAALASAASEGKTAAPSQTAATHSLRSFALALKNALGHAGGEQGKAMVNPLDDRMSMHSMSPADRAGAISRPTGTSIGATSAGVGLPPGDLKSAVIEALGLVLKLQPGARTSGEASERQHGSVGQAATPQTAAQLVRLLRAEILKTLDMPARLAGLIPDAQEQAAVSMMSRAALNLNKDGDDKDTGEILKHLARLLARVQTNQLTSIQAAQPTEADLAGNQTLLLDLPFLHHQAEMVTMLMERYPTSSQQGDADEAQRYGYRIVLDFNFDKSDRITSLKSHIRYTEGTVSAAFWTGSEHEARIVATHLPGLRQELTRWGLVVGELSLQVGDAPPARQGVRKQILNERI